MQVRFTLILLSLLLLACKADQSGTNTAQATFDVPFEKFELDNGLNVVFHTDHSDPVVAVALTVHVGSAREIPGRTGFAHLFEHLLFLESENLGKGGLDKMSARIGGSGANGSTSRDRTNYFQTVPKDALEKMIWAEADKLGWFINTVSEQVLAKEKQVVKNEKRQSVDNRPYGHRNYVVGKNMYPEDHPYNWQVIGSLEDLQNATLEDVKTFFRKWYVPNNSTLTIAGDFDTAQAKEWVKKYFDEIPAGGTIERLPKQTGEVTETIKLYHEDNFAAVPQLGLAWPTVELYHPDSYPLAVLAEYLSQGKTAPLYQVLVEQEQLTSRVTMYNYNSEIAGQAELLVRAYAEKDLDSVYTAIQQAFAQFEKEGIAEKDLNRIKAGQETDFYNGLSSVLGKGFQLAQYNIFAGDPGFIKEDIQNILKVTPEDVMRVYNQYIKGQPFIATSFVPRGNLALALEGSTQAEVVEEAIVQGAEETFDASEQADYDRTPSTFDRTVEPPYGPAPAVQVPAVWETQLQNGLKVYGIENREVPLVEFNLIIDGGQLLEQLDKTGVANLTANLLTKGTANKTPQELEAAIQQLGASINAFAFKEGIQISANTLARNFKATLDLVEEILLEPRWDEKEFDLAKQNITGRLQQQVAEPNTIARNAYGELLYGKESLRAANILGTLSSVEAITLEDLKAYYNNFISPSVARMHIVGAVNQDALVSALGELESRWEAKPVDIPVVPVPGPPEQSQVYFYDVPNAKQSVLRIGYPALAATDDTYYEATIMNYILGGGGFASQLTQQLREGKGYTYGIRSRFVGTKAPGPFTIACGVRSNVTLESSSLIKDILENYGKDYSEKDLETTKGYLIKSNARAFETANAKLNMLENISEYGLAYDYVKKRETIVNGMTVDRIRTLSEQYLDANKMIWLVVGDAQTQYDRMNDLGFGEPILLNKMDEE